MSKREKGKKTLSADEPRAASTGAIGQRSQELDDAELEKVSGGLGAGPKGPGPGPGPGGIVQD